MGDVDEPRPRYAARWVDSEAISEIMNVSVARCTICGGPARVPEDVVAIRVTGNKKEPYVVCEKDQPGFHEQMEEIFRRMQEPEE